MAITVTKFVIQIRMCTKFKDEMEPDFIISEEKVELLAKKTHDEIKFNSEEEYNNFIEKVYGKGI